MTAFLAHDAAQLKAAMVAGELDILLVPGPWPVITIASQKRVGVRIASQDPAKPAVLAGLLVKASAGFSFEDLEFLATPAVGTTIQVLDSADIGFSRLNVHGSLDGDPTNDTSAMMVRNSKRVAVVDSEFQQLANAIAHLDCDGLEVLRNYIHDIRIDGVRGGGSSNVTIRWNVFESFYRLAGDHPDAVQFWNSNTTEIDSNIEVSDNVLLRGAGTQAQGIFITAQISALRYRNVTVARNLVVGGMYHGITVAGADGVSVVDNIVAGFPDMNSRITVEKATAVTLTGNQAPSYILDAANTYLANENNAKIPQATDGGLALLAEWAKGRTGLHPALVAKLPKPAEPSVPVDPKDAEITALQAQVTGLTADLATAADRVAEQAGLLTEAGEKLATANDQLTLAIAAHDAERGKVAGLKDVLGAISKTAAEAASP